MTSRHDTTGNTPDSNPADTATAVVSARRPYLSLAVLLTGLCLTAAAFQMALTFEQQRLDQEVAREAETRYQQLLKNIRNYEQVITALGVLFHYSTAVTREEFHGAAAELSADNPGIQALEWIPRVPGTEREQLESQVRRSGLAGFRIIERLADGSFRNATPRQEYLPILYAEPYTTNQKVIGYDLTSAPSIETLRAARDDGAMRATQAFQLAQETQAQLGWIIILPVYADSLVPATLAERRRLLKGYLQGVFRLPDMLNATWGEETGGALHTRIFDTTAGLPQEIYVKSAMGGSDGSGRHTQTIDADILGRQWRFDFTPDAVWLRSHQSSAPYFILGSGLALTLLMAALLHYQLRRTEIIEAMVAERTEAVRIGADRLQLAIRAGRMCAWEWDVASNAMNIISADRSSGCYALYQTTTRSQFLTRVHSNDREMLFNTGNLTIAGNINTYSREFRVTDHNNVQWISEHGMAIHGANGKCQKIIGVARNITTEKHAELDLSEHLRREQEARSHAEQLEREKNDALILLDTLINSSPAGMSLLDTEYRFLRTNNTICELLGRDREEIIGRPVYEMLGAQADEVMPLLEQVASTRRPVVNYELRTTISGAAAQPRHLLANYYPVLSSDGRLQGIGTVLIDITEKRQAEQAVRESSERFELLAKATNDSVWDWNIDTGTIWRNLAGLECLPVHDSSITDIQIWQDTLHPDDRERVVASLMAAVAGTATEWRESYRSILLDGSIAHVINRGYILRDDTGRAFRVIGAKTDITEQKEFEQRIHQLNTELEKRVESRTAELRLTLEELESFSYSVSHDLRAPLRTVNGFAKLLLEDLGQLRDEQREYLQRIGTAAEHMDELITDLLRLSRISRQDMTITRADISAMAEHIVTELRSQFPGHHPVVIIPDGLHAYCDSGLVHILLTNLLNNAFKFTQKTPAAVIELGRLNGDGTGQTGFYLKDNGAGFDMQYSKQLFSPFRRLHSSKEFEGTGIGLATVRRIARRHGGDIRAESAPGQGATFFFWLST